MKDSESVEQIGVDVHRRFSMVAARDPEGLVVWRKRLRHEDRTLFRKSIASWPKGTPVIMEATFGWGWLSDEFTAVGLDPHLASQVGQVLTCINHPIE